jgi:hypothetical protein
LHPQYWLERYEIALSPREAWLFAGICLVAAPGVMFAIVRSFWLYIDFAAYYLAARIIQSADPAIYDTERIAQAAELANITYTPYLYPPFFALLLMPLAALPYEVAKGIWMLLNLGFWVASVALLMRVAHLPRRLLLPNLLATAFLMPSLWLVFGLGQADMLMLLLMSGALALLVAAPPTRWHAPVAGGLLGVAVAIKAYAAPLGVLLLLRRRLVALLALIGTTLAGFLIGVAAAGWHTTLAWFTEVAPGLSETPLSPRFQSFHAVLARLFVGGTFTDGGTYVASPLIEAPAVGNVLTYAAMGVVGLATLGALVETPPSQHAQRERFALEYGLIITATLLLSSRIWSNYYILLLIPAYALLRSHRHVRAVRWSLLLAGACFAIHLYWRVLLLVVPHWANAFGLVGVLLIWVALLRVMFQPAGGKKR